MGMSFSCPSFDFDDLEYECETVFMRSFSFKGDDVKTVLRSVSFNGRDSEPPILKSLASSKMLIEGSLSFKRRQSNPFSLQTTISIRAPCLDDENFTPPTTVKRKEISDPLLRSSSFVEKIPASPLSGSKSPKDVAAVTLQKIYKSFRTRRQLADCAVLVEQRWWKLLDFAVLKRSSISFFDIDRPESAFSRWSRARTRAAMVGKGLSKDDKARKLALQHWLEAIDPRHRYGHNLQFYYDKWLKCDSKQPFFYWLDVGEGRDENLIDQCPRSKLQSQCIKYLGPKERECYEVIVEDGKFLYKKNRKILDTSEGPKDVKWIFVLSTSKVLYVGQKKKGTFQHSSFLAGGATSAAGRLVVEKGILTAVWPHSGHYRPTEENFQEFVSFLEENKVDLTDVKKSPTDEEGGSYSEIRSCSSMMGKRNLSEPDLTENADTETRAEQLGRNKYPAIKTKITNLLTPKRPELFDRKESEILSMSLSGSSFAEESQLGGEETGEESLDSRRDFGHKMNLFEENEEGEEELVVPQESILRRINSRKGMNSYQLGKQLSFKWTTGMGPRIGCVRDYPSELQLQALEQVALSPRSSPNSGVHFSPRTTHIASPRPSGSPLKESSNSTATTINNNNDETICTASPRPSRSMLRESSRITTTAAATTTTDNTNETICTANPRPSRSLLREGSTTTATATSATTITNNNNDETICTANPRPSRFLLKESSNNNNNNSNKKKSC